MLREDNADLRLSDIGRRLGLVSDTRWDLFSRKRDAIANETARLKRCMCRSRWLWEKRHLYDV